MGRGKKRRRDHSERGPLRTRPGASPFAHPFHERAPVEQFRCVLIVPATKQTDQAGVVDTAPCEALDVVEFQAAGLGTPVSMLAHERASAAVALEDDPLDGIGDVMGIRGARDFLAGLAGLAAYAEPFLLDLVDDEVERLLQDRCWVAGRNAVAEQVLGLAQLVAEGAASGELDLL